MALPFRKRKILGKLWIIITRGVVIFGFIVLAIPTLLLFFPDNANYISFTNYPIGVQSFPIPEDILGYNFYLRSSSDLIGVWHLVSSSALDVSNLARENNVITVTKEQVIESLQSPGKTIIIYMHGKSYTRFHYKRGYPKLFDIGKNGTHVITFDYAGFAESSGTPSGRSVVNNVQTVLTWVKTHAHPTSTIVFYGHSLGTGITARVVKILHGREEYVHGILFEAPYSSLIEAIVDLPEFILLLGWMPFGLSQKLFTYLLDYTDLNYNLVEDLATVESPMLLFHAEDDPVVQFEHGYKLYKNLRKKVSVDCKLEINRPNWCSFISPVKESSAIVQQHGGDSEKNNLMSLRLQPDDWVVIDLSEILKLFAERTTFIQKYFGLQRVVILFSVINAFQ